MNTARLLRLYVTASTALVLGTVGRTAGAIPAKSGYSLANPTPTALLREFNTDRPDATEGPFTVDAGHEQIEMDLLNHTSNHLDGVRTKEWGAAAFNVRLGLLNNFELGVFVSPYIHHTERPRGGPSETARGFGDITLRAKLNFFGNDGGGSALGLITDLKLPTAARGLGNGAVEGAVFLPTSLELGGGWDLGAMTGVDLRRRDTGGGRRGVWINSITTGHGITENLAGYVELTSETGDGAQVATLDTGLTLKLDASTQLDVGVQLGLSRNADDAVLFVGLARRY